MQIAFLNPQGNFDPQDSYWTEHPDFGGQLVYVKQVALAMGELGHQVDILTRQIKDPDWPEFSKRFDSYPEAPNVRIVRLPAGTDAFLRKERLWPHLVEDWVPNILDFYQQEGGLPDAFTAHYGDGGLVGVLLQEETGLPFSFTAHSLGAQKMDKLHVGGENLTEMEAYFHFSRRLTAERLSMNRSAVNITSTRQERFVQYSHPAYRGAVDWTDDSRFAVIPPGVNLEIFDKDARIPDEERVSGYIEEMLSRDLAESRLDKPCIVASSRLDPKKNHLALVEAFAASSELRDHANLVIITGNLQDPLNGYEEAGETEKKVLDALTRVIREADLQGEISLFAIQGQQQLGAAYRALARKGSVFALTALYEPFGLAPLEAIAAGMPAVVTKFGGPSESLLDGDQEFGLLVDPSDREEISTALFSLIISPEKWQHYAEAGYQRVLSRYIWERTAAGYLHQLEKAAQDRTDQESGKVTILPIHPYFKNPTPENDMTLEDLKSLYLEYDLLAVGETLVDFISNRRSNSLRTAEEFRRFLGGQPANVAVYVAKLGGKSAVLSKVSEDRFGEFLEESLQHHGVSTAHLMKTDQLPTTSVFITKTTGVPDFQVNRGADTLLTIQDTPEELIKNARCVHTSCFALSREPTRSAVRRALRLARRHDKLVSLDPNYSPRIWPDKMEAWEVLAQIMPYVTVVKPSLEDARLLFDPNMSESELEQACLERFHDLGAAVVIVTRSGGMVTVSNGSQLEHVGPLPLVEVNSVIGGSDAFWGGLLVAHLDGKTWQQAVCFAHEIAARKLQHVGHVQELIDRQSVYRQVAVNLEQCS
jgi:sucrose-phosphate synthase